MNYRIETPVEGTLAEVIEIYGEDSSGMKLYIPLEVRYNPQRMTTEEAIILAFHSRVRSFDELIIEMGWRNAYWTYPNKVASVRPINYQRNLSKTGSPADD